jgi:hypothetical protein
MTEGTLQSKGMTSRHHIALHLAHRWFAFLEAPGGNLGTHLAMFHPGVRLSGHRGTHEFARDHTSLVAWFAAVPDVISSHHIIHSVYSTADNGEGMLSMVVAYQSPANAGVHGSIISYQTRIEFAPEGARFIALDKTPILPDTRLNYETSWSTNRTMALVHAELAGVIRSDGRLRTALGGCVRHVSARATSPEASASYEALVTSIGAASSEMVAVRLKIVDDIGSALPTVENIQVVENLG